MVVNLKYFLKQFALMVVLIISLSSCNLFPRCADCFSPPNGLALMVLDEHTNENLIRKGIYDPDSIRFYYIENQKQKDLEFDVYNNDSIGRIYSNEIGFISSGSIKTFYLRLNFETIDTIYMDTEIISEDCCTWHALRELKINGEQPDFSSEDYAWIIYKSYY